MANDDNLPHIDAVSGQAAFMLVQALAFLLVKEGVISKAKLQESVAAGVKHYQTAKNLNPAQKAAGHLLAQVHTLLHTADKSDAN